MTGRDIKVFRKGLNKIKERKKLWDMFKWNYGESAQYLWKNTLSACDCWVCKTERFYKKYKHKQERVKIRNLKNDYKLD